MKKLLITGLILMVFLQCKWQSETNFCAHIKDERARKILFSSISKSGGLTAWQSISYLQFEKITTLLDDKGAIESQSNQLHRYFYYPSRLVDISWEDSIGHHQILQRGDEVNTYLNGKKKPADQRTLLINIQSAEFVIMLPFKLTDADFDLTYQGIDTFENQQLVHTIKASYQPQQPSKFDTSDVWWHYFDKDDFNYYGYKVKHEDHLSFVINTKKTRCNGFIFPENRKSYRVAADGKIQYLRADYLYSDYIVEK